MHDGLKTRGSALPPMPPRPGRPQKWMVERLNSRHLGKSETPPKRGELERCHFRLGLLHNYIKRGILLDRKRVIFGLSEGSNFRYFARKNRLITAVARGLFVGPNGTGLRKPIVSEEGGRFTSPGLLAVPLPEDPRTTLLSPVTLITVVPAYIVLAWDEGCSDVVPWFLLFGPRRPCPKSQQRH